MGGKWIHSPDRTGEFGLRELARIKGIVQHPSLDCCGLFRSKVVELWEALRISGQGRHTTRTVKYQLYAVLKSPSIFHLISDIKGSCAVDEAGAAAV